MARTTEPWNGRFDQFTDMLEQIEVPFMRTSITVTFDPALLTTEFYDQIKALQKERAKKAKARADATPNAEDGEDEDNVGIVIEMAKLMIVDWSLTAGGEKVPVTEAMLRKVPMELINTIVKQIQESVTRPKRELDLWMLWAENPNLIPEDLPDEWQRAYYSLFVAAQIVGKAPWELMNVPLHWINRVIALNNVHQTRINEQRGQH